MYVAPVTVKKLQKDDALNIRIAAHYLAYSMQQMPSWERGMIGNNTGPHLAKTISKEQVEKNAYLKNIRRRMQETQELLATVDGGPPRAAGLFLGRGACKICQLEARDCASV